MTTAAEAFLKWRGAEQDVQEARLLMLDEAREGDAPQAAAQHKVVLLLQRDAAERLREYLCLVEEEAKRLRCYNSTLH